MPSPLTFEQIALTYFNPHDPFFLRPERERISLMLNLIKFFVHMEDHPPTAALAALIGGVISRGPIQPPEIAGWGIDEANKAENVQQYEGLLAALNPPQLNDFHIGRWALAGEDEDIRYVCAQALLFYKEMLSKGASSFMELADAMELGNVAALDTSLEATGRLTAAWAVCCIGKQSPINPFRQAVVRLYPSEHMLLLHVRGPGSSITNPSTN